MPQSKSAKGNKDKARTKKWFLDRGYATEYLEMYRSIFVPGKPRFLIKRDLFGSDGMSMDGERLIYWNSKSREKDMRGDLNKYLEFPFPKFVIKAIFVWPTTQDERGRNHHAKEPLVLSVKDSEIVEGWEALTKL